MLNQPFFQITLPLMVTMVAAVWAMISTNNRRLDDIVVRLARIEERLAAVERKIEALEHRAWR